MKDYTIVFKTKNGFYNYSYTKAESTVELDYLKADLKNNGTTVLFIFPGIVHNVI